jgi:tRNA nucleotidyltransferase/poly(A) polymerase
MRYFCITKQGIQDFLMKEHLQDKIFQLISEAADEQGNECYVIGGYVRDIFLKRPSKDIDVVTVGSGIELAEKVTQKLGKRAQLTVF